MWSFPVVRFLFGRSEPTPESFTRSSTHTTTSTTATTSTSLPTTPTSTTLTAFTPTSPSSASLSYPLVSEISTVVVNSSLPAHVPTEHSSTASTVSSQSPVATSSSDNHNTSTFNDVIASATVIPSTATTTITTITAVSVTDIPVTAPVTTVNDNVPNGTSQADPIPLKFAISPEIDAAVLEILAQADQNLKLSKSDLLQTLKTKGFECSPTAHFSRVRGVKSNNSGTLYWLRGTRAQAAGLNDLTPAERAEREQKTKQLDKKLENLVTNLRSNAAYNGNTLDKLIFCANAVEELLGGCQSEFAQGFYARSGFMEVQRLCDKIKMGRYWLKCHKRARAIVVSALALPHNTESQTNRLRDYLTECDAVEESEEDASSDDDGGLLMNKLHPREHDLAFWGKGLSPVSVDAAKLTKLSNEIREEVARLQPNDEFKQRQTQALEKLRDLVKGIEPAYQVQLFGSVVYGLDTMSSDLDCGIVGCAEEKFLRFLTALAAKLKSSPQSYSRIIPIFKGRVPIVRYTDVKSKIDVDVSLLKTDSQLIKTRLLVAYRNLDARFTTLIHLVKQFARANLLGDASMGGLNSFGWTMLVLQFCQLTQPAVLPNLQSNDTIENSSQTWTSANTKDIGTLLLDFFMFYTRQFRPFFHCVSVRSGALISAIPYRSLEEENKQEALAIPTALVSEAPSVSSTSDQVKRYTQQELINMMSSPISPEELEKMRKLTSVVHQNAKFASVVGSCYSSYVKTLVFPSSYVGFQATQRTFLCIEDPVDKTDNIARGLTGVMVDKIYRAMLKAIDSFCSSRLCLRELFQPIPRPLTRHAMKKLKRAQENSDKTANEVKGS